MNSLNPLTILDDLLADYVSAKYRRILHAVILLAAAVISIYLAVNGDWKQFAFSLASAIYAASNAANTHPDQPPVSAAGGEVTGVVTGSPNLGPDEPEDNDASLLYGDGAERGDGQDRNLRY